MMVTTIVSTNTSRPLVIGVTCTVKFSSFSTTESFSTDPSSKQVMLSAVTLTIMSNKIKSSLVAVYLRQESEDKIKK